MWGCIPWGSCYNRGMFKIALITFILLPCAIIYFLDKKGLMEETIKPSPKKKALKSQGILLAGLAILGIF